jgi:hypothetical protein
VSSSEIFPLCVGLEAGVGAKVCVEKERPPLVLLVLDGEPASSVVKTAGLGVGETRMGLWLKAEPALLILEETTALELEVVLAAMITGVALEETAQSVADTVTVETTVTVTIPLLPTTTVGVTTPLEADEGVVATGVEGDD